MTDTDRILAALLFTATLALGVILIVVAIGFFRQVASEAGDCWRADLF